MKRYSGKWILGIFIIFMVFFAACKQENIDPRFHKKTFVSRTGISMPFRFFSPLIDETQTVYPLIIFLHGGQGAGTDNNKQISGGNYAGSHLWLQESIQRENPAYVIAPQLPGLYRWNNPFPNDLSEYAQITVELIDSLKAVLPIDAKRIYITGQSRGGWGVWDLVFKRPDIFAAAIPVCGGGDANLAYKGKNVAIWAFHGVFDREVDIEFSREIIAALKKVNAKIKYTEYLFSGHSIWDKVYREPELVKWLFSQKKR